MDEVEFDKFADEYRSMHAANIKLSGEDPEYFAEYKVVDIAAELSRDAQPILCGPRTTPEHVLQVLEDCREAELAPHAMLRGLA